MSTIWHKTPGGTCWHVENDVGQVSASCGLMGCWGYKPTSVGLRNIDKDISPNANQKSVGSDVRLFRFRACSFWRMQKFIRVSYLDQPFEEESVGYLRANITVFTGTVPLQKILALPAIVLDFNCRHTKWSSGMLGLLRNRLKSGVTSWKASR